MAKFNREVVNRVRVADNESRGACRRLGPGPGEARRVINGARWLPLTNRTNLTPTAGVRLDELLPVNRTPFRVYVRKEQRN